MTDIVDIGLSVDSTSVKSGTGALKRFGDQATHTGRATDGLNARLIHLAAGVVSLTATFKSLHAVIGTSAEFEQYQIRMQHLLGSVQEGNKAYADMIKLAQKMPFEFKDIMESATQLSGVVHGGANEINKMMPMIGDLAAVSGLSIQDTTRQVVNMFSSGAASAQLFRDRGVLAMMGFQSGVTYSVEKTRKMMMDAWEGPTSKFRGASLDLAKSWDGLMSMMDDRWTIFKKTVGDEGAFTAAKGALQGVLNIVYANETATTSFAKAISDKLVVAMEDGVQVTAMGIKAWLGFEAALKMASAEMYHIGGEAVDFVLAGLDKLYGALSMLPGSLGAPYAQAQKTIEEARKTVRGFAAAANDDVDNIAQQFSTTAAKIDETTSKMIGAIQKGQAAAGQSVGGKTTGHQVGGSVDMTSSVIATAEAKYATLKKLAKQSGVDLQAQRLSNLAAESNVIDIRSRLERQALELRASAAKKAAENQAAIDVARMQSEFDHLKISAAQRAILQSSFNQALIDRKQKAANDELMIEERKNAAMTALDRKTHQERLAGVQGMFSNLATLMNTHNKQAFEIGKAAAIANTVISTYSSAQKAFDSLAGIPIIGPALGTAAAAAAIAAGMARVAAISSTQMGTQSAGVASGGGTPNVGGGNAATPNSTQSVQSQQTAAPAAHVTVNIQALDPSTISDATKQQIADSLAPALTQAFGRNAGQPAVMV